MVDLLNGYLIQTKNFKQVIVGEKLGEGGQGVVYKVDYDGKPKTLKWYSGKKFKDPISFMRILKTISRRESPPRRSCGPKILPSMTAKPLATSWICDP